MSSWNSRPLASLSIPIPRFYPTTAASSSSKQVQPNTPSVSSLHYSSPSTNRPPRTSAPQPYISSPTNCTSPSHSRSPYIAYDDVPPITPSPASGQRSTVLPPNTILVQQANGSAILVSLPPQPVSRPPSQHSYFRTQQLSQAVAPLSPAALSFLRSSSAPSQQQSSSYCASEESVHGGVSQLRQSSHVSTSQSEYCEPSVTSQSHASVSRRISVHAPLQPYDAAPSAPSPTPPLTDSAAAATHSSTSTSPSAIVSYPTGFSSSSWSMFFLSLPASPIFLHYLSVCLVSYHAALLFVSVLLFLLTVLPSLSPLTQPLCFYLLFYAIKSVASLSMCAYRLTHPDCWQVDELTASRRSPRYHICRHVLRCVSVASTGVVTWWLFSADDSWSTGTAVSRFVLALLCVEYLSIVVPLLSNLVLSFFVPCIHLSFYLPYLPFPALQSAVVDEEEDKAGMSEEDLTHLPSTRYLPSALPRDTTCAVCLCEVEEGEEIRQLTCRHMYHRPCIDSWLRKRGVCPLCVRKVSVRLKGGRVGEEGEVATRGGGGIEMVGSGSADVTVDVSTAAAATAAAVPVQLYDVDLHPDQLDG